MDAVDTIIGAIIGILGMLLANRQNARIVAAAREVDRIEAVRQEHLEPYRALKKAMSECIGICLHAGRYDSAVHENLRRNCMVAFTQIHDEEIFDLVTKTLEAMTEWERDGNANTAGNLLLVSQDLSEGIDRIIAGNRMYTVRDATRLPEPVQRLQLP